MRKLLMKYRENAHKLRWEGNNEISLDDYFEVLSIAEDMLVELENIQLHGRCIVSQSSRALREE